jgi:nucleoside-diphosphate-sugar epimerase
MDMTSDCWSGHLTGSRRRCGHWGWTLPLITWSVTSHTRNSVERALHGCDAVLHAAAVYTLDSRAYPEISRTNLRGTETVLDAAVRRGCDPVVHVSSFVALLQRRATVTADSPCRPREACTCSRRRRPRRWPVVCKTMVHP